MFKPNNIRDISFGHYWGLSPSLWTTGRDFLRPDIRISAPFQLKNEQKLSKMMYIIPNFLVQHFGENLNKNYKVTDPRFHSHFYANFHEFLLNLLNSLGKKDELLGKPHILSLFPHSFNKFNKTWALM